MNGLNKESTECVSIIMPVFNGENTISLSVDAILSQSYQDFKLYIINDASTDGTGTRLEQYKDNEKISIIQNDINMGVAETRNCGIKAAKGKYISFCDADDIWGKEKLEQQVRVLDKEEYDVVCSNYFVIDQFGRKKNKVKSPEIITYRMMLKSNFIGNLTGMYNVYRIGKVYQRKIGHEDYLMWLDILSEHKKCYCIQSELAFYRVCSNSLSGNKLKAAKWVWNIHRKMLGFGFIQSSYNFCCYFIYSVIKRIGQDK